MKRALVLLALLSGASCSWAQEDAAPLSSPAMTTPRIKTALGAERGLNGSHIDVDTDLSAKTVTLTGSVGSASQRILAGVVARKQAGGYAVRNQLLVRNPPISPAQKVAGVPARYGRAVGFLQLLARSQKRGQNETFGESKIAFPISDLKRLMSLVSARGITIVDVNENNGRPLVLSRVTLQRDLKRTGSSAFDSFAYVGFIFALDYAQSSQLSSTPTRNGVVIEMASGHRFTWVRERRILRLRKLESLRDEGN